MISSFADLVLVLSSRKERFIGQRSYEEATRKKEESNLSGFSKDIVLHILMEMEESVSEIEENIGTRVLMSRIEKEVEIEAALERIDKELDELARHLSNQRKQVDLFHLQVNCQ